MFLEAARRKANQTYANYREIRRLKRSVGTRSFAQFGEDAVVRKLLPDGTGFYVDVGAGNPVIGSNTYSFYLSGWSGLLIEPLTWNVHLARKVRPRDRVIQAICGTDNGVPKILYEFDPYEYSTTSLARVSELARLGHVPFREHELIVSPLRRLLNKKEITSPSFLTIDVEGMDLEVLQSNDWDVFQPDVIAIEEWESPIAYRTQVQEYVGLLGYHIAGYCGVTSLYVRSQ